MELTYNHTAIYDFQDSRIWEFPAELGESNDLWRNWVRTSEHKSHVANHWSTPAVKYREGNNYKNKQKIAI